METVLQTIGLKKYFKDIKAVDGVDISINKGEYLALLGPNGAGKTTMIEMIEGIQTPDSGEILIKGLKWKNHKNELHKILGISLQETRFIDKLTVWETLVLFGSFYGLDRSVIEEIISIVNLEYKKKSYVVNLSGGQRQKLAMGVALLNKPEILLLDEPTTGLDPAARREIWSILLNLKKERNTTLILTTHYMEEAEYLCDRIIIMDKGKILVEATLEKLLSDYTKGEVIEFSLEDPAQYLDLSTVSLPFHLIDSGNEGKYKLLVDKAAKFLPSFFNYMQSQNINLRSVECHGKTLDDLFISLTGRHLIE